MTVDAVLALADLYIAAGEHDRCIELLKKSLAGSAHDYMHTKMGEVYTLNGDYSKALACFHAAISTNPHNAAAAAGLERLEKLLRGMEPDGGVEGEEEEEEEEEEDEDAMVEMIAD